VVFFAVVKRPGRELTTHLQAVPRSRTRGSKQPLPHTPSWRSATYLSELQKQFGERRSSDAGEAETESRSLEHEARAETAADGDVWQDAYPTDNTAESLH
jgi:hypothetical protein